MAIENEAQAEDALLSAVMAPEQDLAAPSEQDLDEPDEPPIAADPASDHGDDKSKQQTNEESAEDEVEVPGEEGQTPVRIKVSELLASHTEYQKLKGQQAQILEQTVRDAAEHVSGGYRQIEQQAQQTGLMLQAALQMLQPPQPPHPDMLNPQSQSYNPDGYHLAFAQYQQGREQFGRAQQLGAQLLQQAHSAQAQASEARERAELQSLQRVWPEFSSTDTINTFISDMGKAYGYSPEELDASLNDHRNALVARDALAYRALMASGKDVKAKVEAKAPKLVRSKQEAKGGAQARDRDGKGQFASGALASLKKTNSDADAVAYFTGLVKSGRI